MGLVHWRYVPTVVQEYGGEGGGYLDCASRELYPDGSFGVLVELSGAESAQEVRLPDRGVPHNHQLEQIIIPAA